MPESAALARANEAARRGPLFIVLNAASGRNDTSHVREVIGAELMAAGREHTFLAIEDPAQLAEKAREALRLAVHNDGAVVAAGGDGTLNAVAAAVLGSGRPFGVLPQGTFNFFGRTHGIPQDAAAAVRALLGAHVESVQVGQVNGRAFLVNGSVGLYPQLLEDRESWKSEFGRSRVVAFFSGIATLLKEWRQLDLEIEMDGRTTLLRTPTIFVGNNRLQLARVGLEEAQVNAVEEGKLTAIAIKPIGTPAMFGLLARGLMGQLGEAENITAFAFRRLTVRPWRLRKVKVATDGEIFWLAPPLVFEVAPHPLLLMVPSPADRVEPA